jgi:ABC-2 type transport system permease protein
MIAALVYLQAQSLKNQLLGRLRRLRQPKYLIGALFGGAYFFFLIVRPFLVAGRHGDRTVLPQMSGPLWEFLASAAVLLVVLVTWLAPHKRAALIFSEAEIAFLFPAPVRRSALIHYKLIKSQSAIFFTVLLLTVFSPRPGGLDGALLRAAGWWLLLSTINLHILGSSFARTLLLERGVSAWKRRLAALALVGALIGGAIAWTSREIPMPQRSDLANKEAVVRYLQAVADTPPARVLLAPFRAAVRPFLAPDARAFLLALGPAAGLLALHYLWVIRADVAFEEASLEVSHRYAAQMTAVRSGRWQDIRPRRRSRAPFRLSPTGSPAVALLWKNLLGAGQLFSLRVWLPMAIWAGVMGWIFSQNAGRTAWPQVVGMTSGVLFVVSLLIGSQFVRQDFRQDLAAVDLLKTYPMRGWQMALGELLAPALILTGMQWLLLLLMATLLDIGRGMAPLRGAFALAAAITAPTLNLVTLLIPNAAALLFPVWFASGSAAGRGIEVMGQRLIFMLAQLLVFALALAPATLAFALTYLLAAAPLLDTAVALPVSALAASLTLAAEAMFGLSALGKLFERFDPSAER